jgi:hypothetical protein
LPGRPAGQRLAFKSSLIAAIREGHGFALGLAFNPLMRIEVGQLQPSATRVVFRRNPWLQLRRRRKSAHRQCSLFLVNVAAGTPRARNGAGANRARSAAREDRHPGRRPLFVRHDAFLAIGEAALSTRAVTDEELESAPPRSCAVETSCDRGRAPLRQTLAGGSASPDRRHRTASCGNRPIARCHNQTVMRGKAT